MHPRTPVLLATLAGLVAACLMFVALLVGAHAWQDHQTFHLVVALINQNLQTGKLAPLSAPGEPAPAPPPAVVPDPVPTGKPHPPAP